MTPTPEPAQATTDMPATNPTPVTAVASKPSRDALNGVLLALALVFLAVSLGIAYYSANSIVRIWFEPQWVPVVRLPLALGVAAAAGWAILRLTHRT